MLYFKFTLYLQKNGEINLMPIRKELLEVLACPACLGKISFTEGENKLICKNCSRVYPIKDDIPIMLVEEATTHQETSSNQIP